LEKVLQVLQNNKVKSDLDFSQKEGFPNTVAFVQITFNILTGLHIFKNQNCYSGNP